MRYRAQRSGIDTPVHARRRGHQERRARIDAIYGRLERPEQEYQAITQGLRRIEVTIADDRVRREIAERELGALKQRVATLEERISELEHRLRP